MKLTSFTVLEGRSVHTTVRTPMYGLALHQADRGTPFVFQSVYSNEKYWSRCSRKSCVKPCNGPTSTSTKKCVSSIEKLNFYIKSVLKLHVAVLSHCFPVARVHGKALSLSISSWYAQIITEHSYQLPIQLRFA